MEPSASKPTSNLELFRKIAKQFLPSEEIDNPQEFAQLSEHLCDMKLLSPAEAKRLVHRVTSQQQITYPFTFKKLEQLIMTTFADPQSHQLMSELASLKLALRETKGVLAVWKDKGLSQKQRSQLQALFEKGNVKLREFYEVLQQQKAALQLVNEQQLQMISCLDEWVLMQKLQRPFLSYSDYQKHHQKLIDQIFARLRVREVHFKHKRNTSKMTKIEIAVGLDSRNDEPVEVIFVPKRSLDFEILNRQLLTFNAKKQLMLSSHFTRFLGYNNSADAHCFLYFNEYLEGVSLMEIVENKNIELEEETPLFKYWAYLLYRCLYDLFLMCSYRPNLPLAPSDFDICSGGLRLILRNVSFVELREEGQQKTYEAELLQNLGVLILSLLGIPIGEWEAQKKLKKMQNVNVMSCLLNAKQGHLNYHSGRTKSAISFFNLQTHPLFEGAALSAGATIVDNFEALRTLK